MNAARLKGSLPAGQFFAVELGGMPPPKSPTGWADGGLCPFHPDRHAGSFRVNLDTGAFRCFSCGARGGDIVAFVRLRHGVDFRTAMRLLADAWGVPP